MRVCVVGAGLAGLAAACELAEAGHDVVVLERRRWAGGKAYSFVDQESGTRVDNGQHIVMRCTTAYVDFLRRLGSESLIRWQPRLRVPVIDAGGRRSVLAASALPAPLHLGPSFVRYAHLGAGDKLRVARAVLAVRRQDRDDPAIRGQTFGAWLRLRGQSERAVREFWDLIVLPALNCRSDEASAEQALFVFQEGFLKSAEAAAIGLPAAGLSNLHAEPALRYVRERGGEVRTGCRAEAVEIVDGRVDGVVLADGERVDADAYVVALPPRELLELLPDRVRATSPFAELARMRTSPIVNVHLWFDGPVIDEDFVAFTGNDLQWLFRGRDEGHVVLSLSAARRQMPLDKQALVGLLLPQLQRALPSMRDRRLLSATVIKEPEATFVPAPGLVRPSNITPIENLFLAGAYTDTGWPATMESAVRSGLTAAQAVAVRRGRLERAHEHAGRAQTLA